MMVQKVRLGSLALLLLVAACGGSDEEPAASTPGTAGTAGSAGSAGQGEAGSSQAGTGGTEQAGAAGSAGQAGAAGEGGAAGQAGSGAAGEGGAAGSAGGAGQGGEAGHDHEEHLDGRLFFGDVEASKVSVFELEEGEEKILKEFETLGPASVYSSEDGRYGFALQRAQDKVHVFDGGLEVEDHVDHAHYNRLPPAKLGLELSGVRPTHFVLHEGWIGIFNDGLAADSEKGIAMVTASAAFLDGKKLAQAGYQPIVLDSPKNHHGVAVPVGADDFLFTAHNPDPQATSTLPVGVDLRGAAGAIKESFHTCPGLHGEAANETSVAFGCEDGVLWLEKSGASWTATKLKNPEGTPEGTRVGTLAASHEAPFFLGNWGATGLARITKDGTFTPIDVGTAYYQFALTHDAKHIVVLGKDGKLRVFGAESGALEGTVDGVTTVDDPAAKPALPRGYFALHEETAYVTSPLAGKIFKINLEKSEISATYEVGGKPSSIAVFSFEHHEH